MRIMVIRPDKGNVSLCDTEGWKYELANLVGGLMTVETPAQVLEMNILFISNAEGLKRGLPANENLYPFFYVGTVLAVGMNGVYYESLTQAQIDFLRAWVEGLE